MKKRDGVLVGISLLIFLAAYFLVPKNPADFAKISVDGHTYAIVSLEGDGEIAIGETNTARVQNGCIFMETATCPDKLCIKQGKISDSSKKIVCLPNKIIIEVFRKGEIDTVVK